MAGDSLVEELRNRLGVRGSDPFRRVMAEPVAVLALRTIAGESIDRMVEIIQEQDRQLMATADAMERMAQLGWAPCGQMPSAAPEIVIEAVKSGIDNSELDALLQEVWGNSRIFEVLPTRIAGLGAGDDQLRQLSQQRARLVNQAWKHHERGEYAASIPIALAQVDGITYDATANSVNPTGLSLFSSSTIVDAAVADDETVAGMNAALPAVRRWFFDQAVTTSIQGALNRHAVLHGRELAYDTDRNSLKAFVLLLAVWEWASRKFAKETDRRKEDRYLQHAGADEVDSSGWRLDRRGFVASRDALRQLAIAEWSFAQRNGRSGTLEDLTHDAVSGSLLKEPDLITHQLDDGGSWWAWRRSESGWVFAIGALPDNDKLFYADGDEPPMEPPPNAPWRTTDDGNWSGDCHW